MRGLECEEVLDLFLWGLDKLMKPTLSNLLAGYEEYAYRTKRDTLLHRLEQRHLIEREGRGARATFRITAVGRQRMAALDPLEHWNKPWDGVWRVITFDVPEARRRDRKRLWQALRARKLGLLQRSVWIWPHDVQPILDEIIDAEGIPECFCGFEARRLFLCTNAELVTAAWDFEEITRRHRVHSEHPSATVTAVKSAKDLRTLATLARAERQAYAHAFSFDPLLPRVLLPKGYLGLSVQRRHLEFRTHLHTRLQAMAK